MSRLNIKRTNKPNPICDGSRYGWGLYGREKAHAPCKMKPFWRPNNGDYLEYMCPKCYHFEKVYEPCETKARFRGSNKRERP